MKAIGCHTGPVIPYQVRFLKDAFCRKIDPALNVDANADTVYHTPRQKVCVFERKNQMSIIS